MAEQYRPQTGRIDVPGAPEPEAIREALARVLRSETFANAPGLRCFLQHVVEHTLRAGGEPLKEYALGVDVFGRGVSFDPRTDTIVRVQARRLRSKLHEYYQREGLADPVTIRLPKGRYVPEFRAPGALPAPLPLFRVAETRLNEQRPGDVPSPRTTLIGREHEIADVKRLLQRGDARLVTLTGPGGSGKTRLGAAVCAELDEDYPGGIWFVALAPVTTADSALATIAHRVGIRHTGGASRTDALRERLARDVRARTLLFLDNFEHVLSAGPALGQLLEASTLLQILVTSRAVLRVSGEHEYPVPPLPLPDAAALGSVRALAANPAVALFVQRALAVKPDFALTAGNAGTVAQICARLDGLPLAIELAAGRVKMFTPEVIRVRLHNSLDFLSRGPADVSLRHQALRSTIDWSYELLSGAEQLLFRRLSVFRGGCTLESVEAVCNARRDLPGNIEDLLASLLDKSLLQQTESKGESRFSMLETIREYASERLLETGEADRPIRALVAYCIVVAEEGNRQLTDPEREIWLEQCEAEHDNMRVALEWIIERENAEWGYRLVLALYAFWERREYLAEGREWTEAVLGLPTARDRNWSRAKALAYAGAFATAQGDFESVRILNHGAIDIFRELGDAKGVIAMLNALAVVERLQDNWGAAQSWHEQSLAAAREADDRAAVAAVLSNLADIVSARGDHARARRLFEEALAGFRELGDSRGVAWTLNHLGDVARARRDFGEARELYEQADAAFRAVGDRWGTARTCADRGELACEEGNYARAMTLFDEAMQLFVMVGHRRGIAMVLEGLANLFAVQNDPERVLIFAAAASVLRQRIGAPPRPREQVKVAQAVEFARARDPRTSQAIWARASQMTLTQIVSYSQACLRAGRGTLARGRSAHE